MMNEMQNNGWPAGNGFTEIAIMYSIAGLVLFQENRGMAAKHKISENVWSRKIGSILGYELFTR